jgi:hypothetical protein
MIAAFLAFLASLALLLGVAEIGFFLGRRHRADSDQEGRSQVSMVEGALLGVLGLLIGFTFSMAVNRFDLRQDLVVQESNALSTFYLRTDLLPEPARTEVRTKLREYADVRVEYARAGTDPEKLALVFDNTARLQAAIWAPIREEARKKQDLLTHTLTMAMTQAFDLAETRRVAFENRVPASVWVVLYVVAALASSALGLGSGYTGRRVLLSVGMVPLLLSVILTLLIDLAQPREGLIRVKEDTMLRLRAGMK